MLFSVTTYVYRVIVAIYLYNNFYLVSTYVYGCTIDFICGNLYHICAATHVYNRFYFVEILFYMLKN